MSVYYITLSQFEMLYNNCLNITQILSTALFVEKKNGNKLNIHR